jgi:paraquat-inducible protein B
VGSAVKFKGVTIGQVESIRIRMATADTAVSIPVTVEINSELVADTTGEPLDLNNRALVKAMVTRGLRGSLELESFLTGMLYVGLNVYSNAPPPVFVGPANGLPEIPTTQTGLQKLASSLPKVERILDRVEGVAGELESMIKQIQAGKLNDSLLKTLADAQKILQAPSITNTFIAVEGMANEFKLTASDLRTDIKPLMKQLMDTATGADQTVEELNRLLTDARRLVGDDSPMVGQLVSTLSDFQRTAVALRQLADFLARNPQSILTGRDAANSSQP